MYTMVVRVLGLSRRLTVCSSRPIDIQRRMHTLSAVNRLTLEYACVDIDCSGHVITDTINSSHWLHCRAGP